MSTLRSLLALLALGLFAVYLAAATFRAAFETAKNLVLFYNARGETPFQERARAYGLVYAHEIEVIRRTIPPDGAYVLFNGRPNEKGGPLWVKFDLAPRRAVFLGDLQDAGGPERLKKRIPRAARWVVIAYGTYDRPVVIERYKFIQSLKEKPGA